VIVVPSRVQGAGAAAEVATALSRAAQIVPPVEVIALVRGGGSLEDLWAFNEEPLVRAVAASPIPVVAGVGHEIDVTLADLAADVRALTPTDAAVRISPDRRQLLATVRTLHERLEAGLRRRTATARENLDRLASSRMLVDPSWILRDRRMILDTHEARLQRLMAGGIERARERLVAAAGRLDAVSPLAILARGYSITWLEDNAGTDAGRAVRPLVSAEGVKTGMRLVTQLATGRILSRVEGIDEDDGEASGMAAGGDLAGDESRRL
jgi:exodeoxyribonuclease VII large subunit